VLTVRRFGCAVLVLIVVAVAALALLDRAADGVAALFVDEPDAVAGSPFDTVAPSTPAGSGSEVVDRIVARDRLIVAVQEVPGLVEHDPATGEYTGFDIALLDLVARGLGADPERTSFKPLPAGSREAALERGEVDLVAGEYEITDQRRAEMAFARSQPRGLASAWLVSRGPL
jgi:glutamate transport system substrate-binding protein